MIELEVMHEYEQRIRTGIDAMKLWESAKYAYDQPDEHWFRICQLSMCWLAQRPRAMQPYTESEVAGAILGKMLGPLVNAVKDLDWVSLWTDESGAMGGGGKIGPEPERIFGTVKDLEPALGNAVERYAAGSMRYQDQMEAFGRCGFACLDFFDQEGSNFGGVTVRPYGFQTGPGIGIGSCNYHVILQSSDGWFIDFAAAEFRWKGKLPLIFRNTPKPKRPQLSLPEIFRMSNAYMLRRCLELNRQLRRWLKHGD